MNYTEKYHLPQWEESDRVMRTDFNQMCADIENGIKSAAQAAQTAQSTAEKLPYVLGNYTGDEDKEIVINIGFRPSLLLIFTNQATASYSYLGRLSAFSPAVNSGKITFTDTGFIVAKRDRSQEYPMVNYDYYPFQYVAFQ
ncbi:MAG: hypothetical protein HFF79_08380 [Oscillospiraceae bacterium]|nr:hypothetical protein [Oscillospiraceae bacterium]